MDPIFDSFKNEREKMSKYRKGGEIKKMIIEDYISLSIITLIISILLITRRIK